jgi:phage replication O-like protein O
VQVAREFFDALLRQRLTGREWTVFMAVLRLTWGWQKKADRIGSRQIARLTGIDDRDVRYELAKLRRRKMLARRRSGQWYVWGIRKDFDLWIGEVRVQTPRAPAPRGTDPPESAGTRTPESAGTGTPTPKTERKKESRGTNSRPQSQSQLTHLGETIRSLRL